MSVVGLPAGQDGTGLSLADLVPGAGQPNLQDNRSARTLQDRRADLFAVVNLTQKISDKTSLALYANYRQETSVSFNGFAQSALLVPTANPFSPFGDPVGVNYVFAEGPILRNENASRQLNFTGEVFHRSGDWQVSAEARFVRSGSDRFRPAPLDQDALADRLGETDPALAFNPFGDGSTNDGGILADIFSVPIETNQTTTTYGGILSARGPLFTMPAGKVRLGLSFDGRRSESVNETFGGAEEGRVRAAQTVLDGAADIQVPFLSRKYALPLVQSLIATASVSPFTQGGSDVQLGYAYGGRWSPFNGLTVSYERAINPTVPSQDVLTEPVVFTDNVQVFDPVTQQTAFIRVVTGGNPDLAPSRSQSDVLSMTWRPKVPEGLSLKLRWRRERIEDAVRPVPPFDSNSEIFYPDRVVRDAAGQLVSFDQRPLNQFLVREESLRVRFRYRNYPGADDFRTRPAISLRVTYERLLRDEIVTAPGAPVQDFISGDQGLTRIRDELNSQLRLGFRGLFAVTRVNYEGGQVNRAGEGAALDVFFPSLTTVSLGLSYRFSENGLLGGPDWLRGFGMNFTVGNVFDRRRQVLDDAGNTPTLFQPDFQDPLGRVFFFRLSHRFD